MDELQNLEQLLQELLNGLQDTLQSGEILTDDFQLLLAEELNWITNRIDELRAASTIQPTPELDGAPFPSSNINAFKYDPKSQTLYIKFQDKYPKTNGPVYKYDKVPAFIYEVFRRGAVAPKTSGRNAWNKWRKGVTPSLGASAYALVRLGGYPYQRVS